MKPSPLDTPAKHLYEEDFHEWTVHNAELLRAGRLMEADLEHIAEEIEDLGKSDRREMESRLRVLVAHLLKWGWQREKRSNSWKATAANQRAELRALLRQSPSLKSRMPGVIAQSYRDALRQASLEADLPEETFPQCCPFTPEQVLDDDYFPQ